MSDYLYIIDFVLVVPVVWLVAWLFAGAVTGNGCTLRIGWPWCLIGLLTIAGIVLRLTGVIA